LLDARIKDAEEIFGKMPEMWLLYHRFIWYLDCSSPSLQRSQQRGSYYVNFWILLILQFLL
jgi:hypothetical protein